MDVTFAHSGQADAQEVCISMAIDVTQNDRHANPILVIGGTGKTGRRVAQRLTERGLPARIGSRLAQPPFDWEDRETWRPVLRGASAAYVTYAPDLAVPGAVAAVQSIVGLAREEGLRRLVLLSGRGEEEAQAAEKVVQGSGLEWAIVRASWFMQNFSESYLVDGVLAGEVVLPAGDVGEPFVDADDIADVAVAALTGRAGQIYEVTGARLLTFAQAVAEIAAATGRPIHYAQVSPEDFAAALREQGVPEDVVWLLNYLFTTVLDGRNAHLTDGVQRALGRPPRDFADFARQTAANGVWEAVPAGAQSA
jgi:uncharacterized protein YbjT (DUF2867 family)